MTAKKFLTKIQNMGGFLSQSIMPNMGALLAWGLLTALVSANGWWPNPKIQELLNPMLQFAIPILIAYTGGFISGQKRGGAVGVMAVMGLIVGSRVPMIFGAMVVGPLAGWLYTRSFAAVKKKVPIGFEMLVANGLAALWSIGLSILGLYAIGPMIDGLSQLAFLGISTLMDRGLVFLTAILIEPGKLLFLNNAINHGILSPLGLQEAAVSGKSLLFLLETNPGPGLGLLLAYALTHKKEEGRTAITASLIHAIGGIHEMYFPYVLMQPLMVIPLILGGISSNILFQLTGAGLTSPPSPGSILTLVAVSPKDHMAFVLLGIVVSTAISFLVANFIYWAMDRYRGVVPAIQPVPVIDAGAKHPNIDTVYMACDAGMGSSAMGAALLQKVIDEMAIPSINVHYCALDHLPQDAVCVITFKTLIQRARACCPNAWVIGVEDFLNQGALQAVLDALRERGLIMTYSQDPLTSTMSDLAAHSDTRPAGILMPQNIVLGCESVSKEAAIEACGQLLLKQGYIEAPYIAGMHQREQMFTTYIGNGVAIPHGENAVKDHVLHSGIVLFQYPEGVDFGDSRMAYLVIGIAGKGNEHIELLSTIAEVIEDAQALENILSADQAKTVLEIFQLGSGK